MSVKTRKVVQITEAQGYGQTQGSYRGKSSESAEIIPVDFRREDILKHVSGAQVCFAFVPSYTGEGVDLIVTVPDWANPHITSVGINPSKDLGGEPPDVV